MIEDSGCKHGRDPIMLMPYPGQEPANCEENLAKLEPSVLHKFWPKETNRGLISQNHCSTERWFCDYLVFYVNKENKMPLLCLSADQKERKTGCGVQRYQCNDCGKKFRSKRNHTHVSNTLCLSSRNNCNQSIKIDQYGKNTNQAKIIQTINHPRTRLD